MAPLDNKNISFSPEQVNNALRITGVFCLGILSLLLLVLTMGAVKAYPNIGEGGSLTGIQNTISVSGQAELDVSPDVTVISWSTQADGKTTQEAQDKVATLSNKAMEYLKSKGIPKADIKTTSFNTETRYVNSNTPCPAYDTPVSSGPSRIMPPCGYQSVPSGYTTYETVEVKIRNIDKEPAKTGELMAGLAQIGVKVSGPTNTIDDLDTFKNAARAEAIMKARAEANKLAKLLGVKLVRVVGFNENNYQPYAAYGSMAESKAADARAPIAPDIAPGTNKVTAQVNITYEIR